MKEQELIKGEKFKDLAECLMWCAENKPIWSRQEVESETFEAHEIKSNWVKWFKAIPKPEPVVIEGTVVGNGAYESKGEIIIQTEKFHRNVLARQKVTLTIHQGEE